jgi:hypothetical protein
MRLTALAVVRDGNLIGEERNGSQRRDSFPDGQANIPTPVNASTFSC